MDKQTQQYLLNLVKTSYDDIAYDFDLTRQKHLWPEIIKLADEVKDGDSVLDVGCGNGRLIKAFGEKKINYIGVDSSEKLIKISRGKQEAGSSLPAQAGKQEFIKGDILELEKISQTNFDYIFCIAVLHHIPGQDLHIKSLEQLKNKLKANGKIILTVWNLWSQKKFRDLIIKFAILKLLKKNQFDFGDILFDWKNNQGKAVSQRYYHVFTIKSLKKIIRESGLKIKKMYKDKYNYYAILTK